MVADLLRRHVLVAARVLFHRRHMQPALVRERVLADVRGVPVGCAVQALVDEMRGMRQVRQVIGIETGDVAELEHERRRQRDEIGVAAALAEAIQGALHLAGARAHGRQTVGNRIVGIVVAMDAQLLAGDALRDRGPS